MGEPLKPVEEAEPPRAAISFTSIQFSGGTRIDLGATEIVALVGPNNAGKSAALRELEESITSGTPVRNVLSTIQYEKVGSLEAVLDLIRGASRTYQQEGLVHFAGIGFQVQEGHVGSFWSSSIEVLRPLFCVRLPTETRITASDSAKAIDLLEDNPSHPIHLLFADDAIEERISRYFRRAFGQDLILDRGGGANWPLLVGQRPVPLPGEDRVSASYLKRLRDQTVPLQRQGDGMRSFASVILHLLAPGSPSILLLDEPEAFLHPPQARLIGEFIARERQAHTQLFIATHSPDVLQGLLGAAAAKLRVIRLQRIGSVNHARELDPAQAKQIAADPLMKYSGILSGVFHSRVFITESDSDAMFYGALLDLPSIHGEVAPDVLFVQSGGKHRMASLARALRSLDVPVDVIADFDVLNDEATFRNLVAALGGDPDLAWADAGPLKSAIEQHKPWLNSEETANGIRRVLEKAPPAGLFPRNLKSEIDGIFRKASPWDAIKEAGEAAIPAGQARNHYDRLRVYCAQFGLWIVPVGELEGFCKAVGNHGPKWTQAVLAAYDLETAPELEGARQFIRTIWQRIE